LVPAEGSSNFLVVGDDPTNEPASHEDIHFLHPARWAEGRSLFSRLSWADTVRNVTLADVLRELEPVTVLEVGCGSMHPMGRIIAGMELDTHYFGMDVNMVHAVEVCTLNGRRPAVGIAHDASKSWPIADDTIDIILCLEALEHFATTETLPQFFKECERVSKQSSQIWLATPVPPAEGLLMHPHCHNVEFMRNELVDAAYDEGWRLDICYNYRARHSEANMLYRTTRDWHGDPDDVGTPRPILDAAMLPSMTVNRLVPGNAMYMFTR
jgi:SAM-dependent methyltransferase